MLPSLVLITLLALDGRVLLPDGNPARGFEVTLAGRAGSVRTDAEGRFSILPEPAPPFTIIVSAPDGAVYSPVYVDAPHPQPLSPPGGERVAEGRVRGAAALEIRLEAAAMEAMTVISGVTTDSSLPPANATTSLRREELEVRSPSRLVESLRGVAGVTVVGDGPAAVPAIRGLARGRTLILVDSARVTAERRAGPSATFVEPFLIGSVDVARGPATTGYGSDAFGGVIHIRGVDPVLGRGTNLRWQLEQMFAGRSMSSAAVEFSSGSLLAQIYGRRADDEQDASGNEITNSQFTFFGGAIRSMFEVPHGIARVSASFDRGRDVGKPGNEAVITTYPREQSMRLNAGADFSRNATWSTSTHAFLGTYRLVTQRGNDVADVSAKDASARASISRAGAKSRVDFGVDVHSRFGLEATGSIEDASRIDAGAFAILHAPLHPRFTLSAGLRGDAIESRNRGGFFGDRSNSELAPSGHLAATYAFMPDFRLSVQMSSGFREPTLSDRYFRGPTGRGFAAGNPELEPERSRQLDLGLTWIRGARSLALYAYDYRIRNLVERFRVGNDFNFRNRGHADYRGVELEATLPVARNIEWIAAAAYAQGRPVIDDIAPPNASSTLRWSGARGFVFGRVEAFAAHEDPGPSEAARDAHTTLDLGAGWRPNDRYELRMTISNAGNASYVASTDSVAPMAAGRSVSVAVGRR